MASRKSPDWKARVIAELAELDREDALGKSAQAPVELDQQSVGRLSRQDALLSQSMAQASQTRRNARRVALRATLDRIESGEFGYCDDCGEPIASARLALDPTATRCIDCAAG